MRDTLPFATRRGLLAGGALVLVVTWAEPSPGVIVDCSAGDSVADAVDLINLQNVQNTTVEVVGDCIEPRTISLKVRGGRWRR
jgi:hypothetical protein